MRLHAVLLAVVTMSLLPSIASARSRIRPLEQIAVSDEPYTIGAAIEGGFQAGNLVIALYNPDPIHAIEVKAHVVADTIMYDWLTVEIKNASASRTLTFSGDREKSHVEFARIQPRGLHFETIDLSPLTIDLAPGDYEAIIRWDGQVTSTTFTKHAGLECGLSYRDWSKQDSPSKLPYVLGGLALASLLVACGLAKRAGTAVERVPCSPS